MLTLSAGAAPGYRFVGWSGCPSAQGDVCTLTVDRARAVGVQFAPPLHVTGFHLAFSPDRSRLTATAHLSAAAHADLVGCSFARQPVVASSLRGLVVTCTWSVPTRFRGHRLTGVVELDAKGETLVAKPFHVRVPRR